MKIEPCVLWEPHSGKHVRVTTYEKYEKLIEQGYEWLYDCTESGYGTWADEGVE